MNKNMSNRPKNYKYCIVPSCTSTTIKTPNKYFFDVPRQQKLRKKWCQIIKRDDKVPLSSKSVQHCCEDHFDLETDVTNFMRCKLVGGNMKLRPGVLPSKFDCQQSVKRTNKSRPALEKRQRRELVGASTSRQQQTSKKLIQSIPKDNNVDWQTTSIKKEQDNEDTFSRIENFEFVDTSQCIEELDIKKENDRSADLVLHRIKNEREEIEDWENYHSTADNYEYI